MTGEEHLLEDLRKYLRDLGALLISFSGGLDSSFLAGVARTVLPGRVRCVLLDSPLIPRRTREDAGKRAQELDLPLEVVPFPILGDPEFCKNPPDRCYICKKSGLSHLSKTCREDGTALVDGVNRSDLREYRPGIRAADEEGVKHPLSECGIGKDDIRNLARECGFAFWNQPSSPCLATRIPYGEEITVEKLSMIEEAEDFMNDLGFSRIRVRCPAGGARIEVPQGDMARVLAHRASIVSKFRTLGFSSVTLDLEELRSGSMDRLREEAV